MQIYLLIMFMALFLHDGDIVQIRQLPLPQLLGVVIVPKLALVVLYAAACKMAAVGLARTRDPRWLGRIDRAGSLYRLLGLVSYGFDLHYGILKTVRERFADLILIDLEQPHLQPFYNADLLVYAASGADVRTVIIDGRIVMEEGKLLTIKLDEVMEKVRALAAM